NGLYAPPRAAAYAMSKHAMEAFTDSLAAELAPAVQVSIVEPGGYKSNIVQNEMQRSGTGAALLKFVSQEKDPDDVAAAVASALSSPRPKRRYLVVPEARQAEVTVRTQIARLVQLNEAQPYAYDRDALVKMLDEALAQSSKETH